MKDLERGMYKIPTGCCALVKPGGVVEVRDSKKRALGVNDKRCKNCKYMIKGKHSKGQWWEMFVCAMKPKGAEGLFYATNEYKGANCEMYEPK